MTSNGLLPVLSVLDRCFPVVRSLRQYLEDVLEDSSEHEVDFVPNHEDLPSYHELVNLTYVAMHSSPSKRLMYNLSKENMSEVGIYQHMHFSSDRILSSRSSTKRRENLSARSLSGLTFLLMAIERS